MDGRCAKHQFEVAEDVCRTCGNEFCGECLVYSFGPRKPPFCIACALAAAGVRNTAGNLPAKPKKQLKKEGKARRKAAKESQKHGAASVEVEWSTTSDPTAGLTEQDLRLPSAPSDAARPADAAPAGAPPGAGDEPPQLLLQRSEIPARSDEVPVRPLHLPPLQLPAPPSASLLPTAPPGTAAPEAVPHVDADRLSSADERPVPQPEAPISDGTAAWERINSGRPTLRMRDLLSGPEETPPPPPSPPPKRAEPSFSVRATPEQPGDDPTRPRR